MLYNICLLIPTIRAERHLISRVGIKSTAKVYLSLPSLTVVKCEITGSVRITGHNVAVFSILKTIFARDVSGGSITANTELKFLPAPNGPR